MVKFGGHVEALRDGDLNRSNLYLIPYNDMKTLIYTANSSNGSGHSRDDSVEVDMTDERTRMFQKAWNQALAKAEDDFRNARRDLWQTVFARLVATFDPEEDDAPFRGAHPGNAIKLFVERTDSQESQELMVRMTHVHRAASINSEGLRKIVKKYDKNINVNKSAPLSATLLPLLYTSSLYTGQKMIEDSIFLLRELTTKAEVSVEFKPLIKNDSEFRHQESVEARMQEMEWLKQLVNSIPHDSLLPRLVAHRGFHHIKDRNDKRPLENSLSAYEIAWTSGIHLCECDISLTKDQKLVLAHDENFARLVLDSRSANSKRKVRDLTFKELISMPLLSGVRPPLLIDVLRSAIAISEKSQLIIEIKPGNDDSAFALARMLIHHPDLRKSVAVIMSFDAATMHRLRAELGQAMMLSPEPEVTKRDSHNELSMLPSQHRRVTSFDHFGTMGMAGVGGHTRVPTGSYMDLQSIGLSISQTNLNDPALDGPSTGSLASPLNACASAASLASSSMPKLMLLTVADPPKIPCELQVKCNELHRVDSWLMSEEGSLDGVYLQYEEEMMTKQGAAYLKELSQRYHVGIWGYSGVDPDDFRTFEWLVQEGNCSFVNTDLPKHFQPSLQPNLVMRNDTPI